jgi:hypothetical protein
VVYGFAELDELVLAYATTIHKSQGSEYPAVVIPLTTQHYPMLQRNLVYTGGRLLSTASQYVAPVSTPILTRAARIRPPVARRTVSVAITDVRFVVDSLLEGDGFELSVPRDRGWRRHSMFVADSALEGDGFELPVPPLTELVEPHAETTWRARTGFYRWRD